MSRKDILQAFTVAIFKNTIGLVSDSRNLTFAVSMCWVAAIA